MENQVQSFMDSNLAQSLTNFMGPGVFKALAAILIFWIASIVAKFLSKIVGKSLSGLSFERKYVHEGQTKPSAFISKLVYYILMILGAMIALETLGVSNVLDPLKQMLNKFTQAIPNIIGAGVIGFIGYNVAQIVSDLVASGGDYVERFALRFNIKGVDLSKILKNVVFIIIFLPILISALDYLKLDAITDPAKSMFTTLLNGVPKIIVATVIVAVFYFLSKFVVQLLMGVLESLGIDDYAAKYNIPSISGNQKLSGLIGKVVSAMILLIGLTTASGELEIQALTNILNEVLSLFSKIIFGMIILLIGNFIANAAANMVAKSNTNSMVGSIAKYAILALFIAIALREMGFANEIVELAFGLTLGAVAVAFALMFGLGGRESAGELLKDFFRKLKQ